MKRRNLFAALIFLSGGGTACARVPQTFEVTEKQELKPVTLRTQDILVVRLAVQMGTGFSWQLRDNAHFTVLSHELGSSSASVPGGVSHQVFRLRASRPGSTRAEFRLVRPWEAEAPPQKTFEVVTVIKD
jgi:predicted secreted protein